MFHQQHTVYTSSENPSLSVYTMSDPSSYANTDEVRVRDFALNLSANFETKVLSGEDTPCLVLLLTQL